MWKGAVNGAVIAVENAVIQKTSYGGKVWVHKSMGGIDSVVVTDLLNNVRQSP
jgi:hypothetical protein